MKTTQGLGFLTSLVFVSCASVAHATVIDWSNTSGGDFNNGANWAGGTAPGASDTASFNTNAGSSYTASLSGNAGIRDVSVQNDHVVIDLNEHDLTMQSGISVNGNADSYLVLKNGQVIRDRDSAELATIRVGSESGAKGSLTLQGASIDNVHSVLIGDEGELVISEGSHLNLSNGINVEKGGSLKVSGTLDGYRDASVGGSARFDGEVVVDNASVYMDRSSNRTSINGDFTIQNSAGAYFGDLFIGGNLKMDGTDVRLEADRLEIGGTVSFNLGGGIVSDSSISILSDGLMILDNGSLLAYEVIVDGGELHAVGAVGGIDGDLINSNHGAVYIGPNGNNRIASNRGDYVQDSSSTLALTLGDEDVLTGYKLMITDGEVYLDGTLEIDLWETFKPQLDDEFTLITSDFNIYGMFSNFILPKLDPGLAWDWGVEPRKYGGNLFSLKVVEGHSVPEPYTLVLMTIGLAGFAGARRFRKAA
ncbi:PEP-CTERM sorting domain-containing protein [Hahella aquimaris]|uniref:PEP-CTERM sorting domain-containing protein n=1 Tax=Hahella sp. HNIBRBA332 TaxID=3015983 RepID=UPI00273B3801|nr:PEP-CTERM sorting domain-containing protein [Hahella sp. HNIBRBA332]WLQ13196.1 PEP-CTERM sorting domain-containing protein [Hahella sp. HNIBRBA332]